MSGANYSCERCEKSAVAFGMKGNEKIRSCEDHVAQLIAKGMQIINIAGYDFILTLQDAILFAERENLMQKGRGNLEALETNCQLELTKIIANIEKTKSKVLKDVESRFEEMKVAAIKACTETMHQLSQLRADLGLFLFSKESEATPTMLLICSNLSVTPKLLRFGLADVSDSVSAVLSDSWTVAKPDIHSALKYLDASQKNAAIEDALTEAAEQAERGILEALQYADSIIEDDNSFEEEKGKVLSEFFERYKMQITQNMKWLQYIWSLRQQCDVWNLETAEVGRQLASMLYHHSGQFSEAEKNLRYCYDVAAAQNFAPELSMLLCNEICGVYFATENYQKLENLSLWTLRAFGVANLPSEHYWTTLLYISSSMREASRDNEAKAIVENWRWRNVPEESKLGEMMRLLTCGIVDSSPEAERNLLRAKRIGVSHFPTSPFTALTFFYLGLSTIAGARGEQYLQQAQSIYEVVSPLSAQAAMNLSKLGDLNKATGRKVEAEMYYQQAQSVYEITSPKSYNAALNLFELGDLCSSMGCLNEMEECCRQVESIIQMADPGQRFRLQNFLGKIAALRIRSAPPPVQQEERKQSVQIVIQFIRMEQPAAAPTRQALFRFTLGWSGKGNGTLEMLNIDTKTWEPPLTPSQLVEVDAFTTYAFISDTAVVACGSTLHTGHKKRRHHAAGTAAYRVDFLGPTFTTLPSFPLRRAMAGIYVEKENALAFGGGS